MPPQSTTTQSTAPDGQGLSSFLKTDPWTPPPWASKYRTEPEYLEPFTAWQEKASPETTGALLRALDPVLKSAVRAYAPGSGPALRSRAKQIAIQALPRYTPESGPLKPYLMSHLQGLRRMAAIENSPIRIPERVALDRRRLQEAEVELEDRLGRPPSDDELVSELGMTMDRLINIRKARKPLSEGAVQSPMTGDDGEESAGSPAVFIPGRDDQDREWVEFVYSSLGPRDQLILENVLGLHGRRAIPPQRVAAKLGITPGAVSQRMKKIQEMLDKREEYGLL